MHFLARLQLRRGLQVRQRHPAYRRIMIAVIAVNCAAFMAIASGASLQGSAPLGANVLDFLADAPPTASAWP